MGRRRKVKVHRYEKKRRQREIVGPGRTFLSLCLTFLAAGVIGVVGYSIAKPIIQFVSVHSEESLDSAPSLETALPPVTTTEITALTTVSTETTTQPQPAVAQLGQGFVLDNAALASADSLAQALREGKAAYENASFVLVPLKVTGGAILYNTSVSLAQACGAAQGSLSPREIVEAIRAANLTPVASCSLLEDHMLPDADASAGYLIASSGTRWLDNKPENGGEPWTSPFSDVTRGYLSDLVSEISEAGFAQIWCGDLKFPPFRQTDLEYIGESVQSPNREEALVSLLAALQGAAGETPLWLQVPAQEYLAGTAAGADTAEAVVIEISDASDFAQVSALLENDTDLHVALSLPASVYEAQADFASSESLLGLAVAP